MQILPDTKHTAYPHKNLTVNAAEDKKTVHFEDNAKRLNPCCGQDTEIFNFTASSEHKNQ
jgi:hypothetical protein